MEWQVFVEQYNVDFSVAGGTYPVLWGGSSEPPPQLTGLQARSELKSTVPEAISKVAFKTI